MRKIQLNLDSLSVDSFETAIAPTDQGTVVGNAKTVDGCGSEIDNCPSSLGCTRFGNCETYVRELCQSAVDACASGLGCTEIDCI